MDGRMFFRGLAAGFLLAAAVGCGRNSVQPSPVTGMPMTAAGNASAKSMWGGGGAQVPVEMAPPLSKEPPKADTLVAFADVRLDAAFDERTPPGKKEALLDSAREGYQKALKQEPKNPNALLGVARFYAKVGDRERAIEAYKKYLTEHPKDAKGAQEVAVVHARWKDWAGACAWCEFALKIDPENRDVKKTLGFCQARAGEWDKAFATLSQIMPEAQVRHNLAGLLDHMGLADESKKQLQIAVRLDPNYGPAREFLAEIDQPQAADPNPIRQTGAVQAP